MRLCIDRSSELAPLSAFRSWLDCTINTSGYDFRKGQGVTRNCGHNGRFSSRRNDWTSPRGTKQTSRIGSLMSAFDPKRTQPRFRFPDEQGPKATRLQGRHFCPSQAFVFARSGSAPFGSVSRGLRTISVKRVVPFSRSTVPLPDRSSDE